MKPSLKITIESNNNMLIKSLYEALLPEILNPPSTECESKVVKNASCLEIFIECNRINLLRAVANSYLGLISSIIHSLEGLEIERAKAST